MYRFYCPELALRVLQTGLLDVAVTLPETEAKHAKRVLRLTAGNAVELFDGKGLVAWGELAGGDGSSQDVIVRVRKALRVESPKPLLEIAAAVPKGERVSDMVEQMSQLGVDRWIPLRTARSVVDPRDTKLERLTRAALESAKQCGRDHVLEIQKTCDFSALLKADHATETCIKLFAAPGIPGSKLLAELGPQLLQAQKITVFIGPEGGWTPEEEKLATEQGCLRWSMGPHVMRIETAAVAAAAILRHATMR